MGGSLAGALRGHCRAVCGVARRSASVELALDRDLIDQGATDLARGVREADVVILATPVRVILRQLAEIGPLLAEGCLLMDLGSTKARIVAQMARLPKHVQPLGGHPMCGKETSGIEAADAALYRGCTFILTPLARTSDTALALARALVEAIGARPLLLDAERQDALAAAVSHLPYLMACALVNTADAATSADAAAWQIVAGSFRDGCRVAASDPTMMTDILLTNREEALKALAVCQAQLRALARIVKSGDEDELRLALSAVRERRKEMFP